MKILSLLLIIFSILVFAGCDNNKPLSLLLDESTKSSAEIVDSVAGCYNGMSVDTENDLYIFTFDKECVDTALLGDQWDVASISEMVIRDNFQLEGKTIKLTGEVRVRFPDTGSLILKSTHDNVTVWITVPYSVEKKAFDDEATAEYKVDNTYTFDVLVREVQREFALLDDIAEYDVWCRLIPEIE